MPRTPIRLTLFAFLAASFATVFVSKPAVAQNAAPATPKPIPAIAQAAQAPPGSTVLRVATFNIEDGRTEDIADPANPRLRQIAEIIQRLRPNIILLNEIAYDMPGAPGFKPGDEPGQNGQRFADRFLATPQAAGLKPLKYRAYMASVNTGIPSGFDLDRNGTVVSDFPNPPARGNPTDAGRAYGNDCWGFGTFPGQYGMALLVDERLVIESEKIRTFRLLPWDYMPGAFIPQGVNGTGTWYTADELKVLRLSSKSHWDVPVKLPDGSRIHFFCSHPTPPVFDGPERRNARRNHDEIRFWADYIGNASYLVDDNDTPGGYTDTAPFVILGDLNADPEKGDSFKSPLKTVLFGPGNVNTTTIPVSDAPLKGLEPSDTSMFKLRVDYVLPSTDLTILRSGIWTPAQRETLGPQFPSDHFPVWMEIAVPALRSR